jgi:hypothetical protein
MKDLLVLSLDIGYGVDKLRKVVSMDSNDEFG